MSFIYGLLYLFLTAYPIVFQQIHRFNSGIGGLPYFGKVIGLLLAGLYVALTQLSYKYSLLYGASWKLLPINHNLRGQVLTHFGTHLVLF